MKRWQQIGLVLSLAWIVGGGTYHWSRHNTRAHSMAVAEYESCLEVNAASTIATLGECSQRSSETLAAELKGIWSDTAIIALAPLLPLWIGAYLVLRIWRLKARRV